MNLPPLFLRKISFLSCLFWAFKVKLLLDVLNLVLVSFMAVSILGLFFKTLAGLSFFPKIVYKASCWDCDSFYIGKTKRRLHNRKSEHFKALTQVGHASAVADHTVSTGHNIKWDHFEILATGKSDLQCKIKETLLISDLKPSLNENSGSEKLFLY